MWTLKWRNMMILPYFLNVLHLPSLACCQIVEETGPEEKPRPPPLQCHPAAPPAGSQGVPNPQWIYELWVCPRVSAEPHLSRLLFLWRSSGSTPSCLRMSELPTRPLRLSPDTLKKLILTSRSRDLVLSVMIQTCWTWAVTPSTRKEKCESNEATVQTWPLTLWV